jgi:hypothetical protein
MPFTEQDPLSIYVQRKNGWMSIRNDCVDYFVPEEYAYMLYMYDSAIKRIQPLDYIL